MVSHLQAITIDKNWRLWVCGCKFDYVRVDDGSSFCDSITPLETGLRCSATPFVRPIILSRVVVVYGIAPLTERSQATTTPRNSSSN